MKSSVPVFEKPSPHLSVTEWTHDIEKIKKHSRQHRFNSYDMLSAARELRNETAVTTSWDTYTNDQLMNDRIYEIENWRYEQQVSYNKLRDELNSMTEEKFAVERYLESLQVPMLVVGDCLSKRDQRVHSELTSDQLESELKKELNTIESNKTILTNLCHDAWHKANELKSMVLSLENQLENKDKTLEIERKVRGLSYDSPQIALRPNVTEIPLDSKSDTAYKHWNKKSLQAANDLIAESKALRENMMNAREKAKNYLYLQCQTVETILRKRVFDIESARNEMDWQMKQLETTLTKLSQEIEYLQTALSDKLNPQKLVQTRLEERKKRPEVELVSDRVQEGLFEELDRISRSRELLETKLKQAMISHHSLTCQLQRTNEELANKNQALETDASLLAMRKPLNRGHDCEMDRNIRLLHVPKRLNSSNIF